LDLPAQSISTMSGDDQDLLRRMLAGEEEAFTVLYRRRQSGVYRFCMHMSGSVAIAEEVTQEVFLTLIREGTRYDASRGSVAAYLHGVARNHVLRHLGKDREHVPIEEESESSAWAAPGDTLRDLTRSETIESVRQAVLALPPSYREAVVLCDLEEMSYADAAAALNCAVGTVRSRLHRGRALLVEKMRAGKGAFA
jgi:RNA polymerase sigma-70 factor (ECF subfamily)